MDVTEMSWIIRAISQTDWKQRAYELGAVSGLGYFTQMTFSDWASIIEKAITFGVSSFLAYMAWRRHQKKMKLMELDEQERMQRLFDLAEQRKARRS